MLRFPTAIPLRAAELNEFKEAILSQQKHPRREPPPTGSSDAPTRQPVDPDVERERRDLRDRANLSKAQRIGL